MILGTDLSAQSWKLLSPPVRQFRQFRGHELGLARQEAAYVEEGLDARRVLCRLLNC
jgi:hypothetical protein